MYVLHLMFFLGTKEKEVFVFGTWKYICIIGTAGRKKGMKVSTPTTVYFLFPSLTKF